MARSNFFTIESLGPKQSLTPEGFLLCEDVPIARTGMMLYAAGEIPVEPGPDGIIRVYREDEDVFRPETIASCMGKPAVDDHPPNGDMVVPKNWKQLSVGTVMNPRRGTGIDNDILLGDILISDADAIIAVRDGKREVSCGYSAEYEQTEVGRARQYNIIVNHVALVEKGRCGPRCSIGDKAMSAKVKTRFGAAMLAKLKGIVPTKDEAAVEQAIAESEQSADQGGGGTLTPATQGGVTINLHTGMGGTKEGGDSVQANGNPNGAPANGAGDTGADVPQWFKDFEGRLAEKFKGIDEFMQRTKDAEAAKTAAEEEAKKAADAAAEEEKNKTDGEDSTGLVDEFKDTMARAEILAPGITLPTFDAKAKRRSTSDILCQLRRKALTTAYGTADGKAAIDKLSSGKTNFADASMTCDMVKGIFVGASELAKIANNGKGAAAGITNDSKAAGKRLTNAELNEQHRKFWADQGSASR